MNCQDNSRLKVPLPELCKTTDIGCVPITDGKPDCPPEADQLPLAYDPNSETLWIFSCESRQWTPLTKFSLAELEEVSLDNFKTICDMLKVPVFYNPGHGTIQGHMSLGDFAEKLAECLNLPRTNTVSIIQAGDNVTVNSIKEGDNITYVIGSTGGGPQDSKTLLEAGNNVEITSRTEGSTITYKINATTPEIVDQNDITVLEAGDNVTLTSTTLGNTTTYKVSSTGAGPGDSKTILEAGNNIALEPTTVGAVTTYKISVTGLEDKNDITVVEAGDNVTVQPRKIGNTNTYVVSATGAGPGDSKTVLEAGQGISLTKVVDGATTKYVVTSTVSGADGNDVTVVEAGDNVTVTPIKAGNITTYKISATGGGPQDSKTIIQEGDNITYTTVVEGGTTVYKLDAKNDIAVVKAGTGISVASDKVGDTTTYTVTATGGGGGADGNDITRIVAGDNTSVTSTTSGSTTTYTINSTGGGPQDSKTVVVGGTGIGVTSTTSGATTTYTVTNTGSGGGDRAIFGGDDANGKGNVPHYNYVDATNSYGGVYISGGYSHGIVGETYFSRDMSYRSGSNIYPIPDGYAGNTTPWYLEIELTNPYNSPATAVVELNACFLYFAYNYNDSRRIGGGTNVNLAGAKATDMYCIFSITNELDIALSDIYIPYEAPTFSSLTNPIFKGSNWGILRAPNFSDHVHWTFTNNAGGTQQDDTHTPMITGISYCTIDNKVQVARYISSLNANETKKVYIQYYVYGSVTYVYDNILSGISHGETVGTAGPINGNWLVTAHYNTGIYPS